MGARTKPRTMLTKSVAVAGLGCKSANSVLVFDENPTTCLTLVVNRLITSLLTPGKSGE